MEPLQPDADDSQRNMDGYLEGSNHDEKPARSEQFYLLNKLPLEVLEKIFSYLSFTDRKNIRLVCNSLYEACGRNEHVYIRNANQWEEFRNCRLNNMNVTVDFVEGEWNPVVWKEVGARIRSLHMNTYTPGHRSVIIVKIGIENVIMFCENLRILRITLRNGYAERFCSPSTLREMNILRHKLETLIIQKKSYHAHSGRRPDDWMELFIALLRIFPNVQHYTIGWRSDDISKRCFSCSCSVRPESIDKSELCSGLALMLSGGQDRSRALDILSKLRFSVVSFMGSASECYPLKRDLPEFFEKQKALGSGKTKQGSAVYFSASKKHEFERSVIQRIASHWANIIHLNKEGLLEFGTTCRSRVELSGSNSNLDESLLDIHSYGSNLSTTLTWKHEPRAADIYPREILKRCESIGHLFLNADVSDEMLQTIFQFLPRLKSLEVHLGRHNTCYGLTGSPAERTSHRSSAKGYSIKRLQHLHFLSITSDGFSFEDSIFDEFDFPELGNLHSLNPKEIVTLRNLMLRLPALREVTFHTQQVTPFVDTICATRENRIFITFISDAEVFFSAADRKNFYDSYPSLYGLHVNGSRYCRYEMERHLSYEMELNQIP